MPQTVPNSSACGWAASSFFFMIGCECLGSVWECLEVFGNVSECVGVFGSVWEHFISAAQQWSVLLRSSGGGFSIVGQPAAFPAICGVSSAPCHDRLLTFRLRVREACLPVEGIVDTRTHAHTRIVWLFAYCLKHLGWTKHIIPLLPGTSSEKGEALKFTSHRCMH